MKEKLFQFQCDKEGSIFYYQSSLQTGSSRLYVVSRCPVCGSKRVSETGRTFAPLNEYKKLPTDANNQGAKCAREGTK